MAGSVATFDQALRPSGTRSIVLPPGGGNMSQAQILSQLDDAELVRAKGDPSFSPVLVQREIMRRASEQGAARVPDGAPPVPDPNQMAPAPRGGTTVADVFAPGAPRTFPPMMTGFEGGTPVPSAPRGRAPVVAPPPLPPAMPGAELAAAPPMPSTMAGFETGAPDPAQVDIGAFNQPMSAPAAPSLRAPWFMLPAWMRPNNTIYGPTPGPHPPLGNGEVPDGEPMAAPAVPAPPPMAPRGAPAPARPGLPAPPPMPPRAAPMPVDIGAFNANPDAPMGTADQPINAVPQPPQMAPRPEQASGFNGLPDSAARGLLEFGLATMAAGSQPGATLAGSIGAGGLSSLQNWDRRQQTEKLQKMQERQLAISERGVAAQEKNYEMASADRKDALAERKRQNDLDDATRRYTAALASADRQAAIEANAEIRKLMLANQKTPDERAGEQQVRVDNQAATFSTTLRQRLEREAPKDALGNPQIDSAQLEDKVARATAQAFPHSTLGRTFIYGDAMSQADKAREQIKAADLTPEEKKRRLDEIDARMATVRTNVWGK